MFNFRAFIIRLLVCFAVLVPLAASATDITAKSADTAKKVELLMAELAKSTHAVLAKHSISAPRIEASVKKLGIEGVKVYVLENSPFGLAVYGSISGIVLDGSLKDADVGLIDYILAHEYGHHVTKQIDKVMARAMAVATESNIDSETDVVMLIASVRSPLAHTFEFEADAFAKNLLSEKGVWDASTDSIRKLLMTQVIAEESATHPSSAARLRAMDIAVK